MRRGSEAASIMPDASSSTDGKETITQFAAMGCINKVFQYKTLIEVQASYPRCLPTVMT